MKDIYSFHLSTSFFTYSDTITLDVKLSIILAIAQEPSIQKTYSVQSFLNQFAKRRHTIQAQIKREIIHEFQNLIKYKIIEKNFIEFEDLMSSKYIIFYEIIHPLKK